MKTMRNSTQHFRVLVVILAITTGLLLAWATTLAAPSANFEDSYKLGPQFAEKDDVITYTIVSINTGGLAESVVLSESLPFGVTYIPGSCTFIRPAGTLQMCGPLDKLWERSLNTGDRITTTLAVTVWAGSMSFDLTNNAFLVHDSTTFTMTRTTTANPYKNYLPLVAKNVVSN
jgi:uncharacterized repeat protein (TIGR01451 family)